ncbi:MAG: hypothetical protein ACXQTL_06105 [Methanosarcinales archaeon]
MARRCGFVRARIAKAKDAQLKDRAARRLKELRNLLLHQKQVIEELGEILEEMSTRLVYYPVQDEGEKDEGEEAS